MGQCLQGVSRGGCWLVCGACLFSLSVSQLWLVILICVCHSRESRQRASPPARPAAACPAVACRGRVPADVCRAWPWAVHRGPWQYADSHRALRGLGLCVAVGRADPGCARPPDRATGPGPGSGLTPSATGHRCQTIGRPGPARAGPLPARGALPGSSVRQRQARAGRYGDSGRVWPAPPHGTPEAVSPDHGQPHHHRQTPGASPGSRRYIQSRPPNLPNRGGWPESGSRARTRGVIPCPCCPLSSAAAFALANASPPPCPPYSGGHPPLPSRPAPHHTPTSHACAGPRPGGLPGAVKRSGRHGCSGGSPRSAPLALWNVSLARSAAGCGGMGMASPW